MSIDQQRLAESRAAYITAVGGRHKAWRAFIREQQETLRRRQADAQAIDDLMDPVASAPPFRARLDQSTRAELSAVLDLRRQDLHRKLTDDARTNGAPAPNIEDTLSVLLEQIFNELDGKIEPQGRALVWFKDQQENDGRLMAYDHRTVQNGTSDDEYRSLNGDQALKSRQMKVIGGIAAGMLVVVILLLVFHPLSGSTTATATASQLTGRVGGSNAPLWDISTTNLAGITADKVGASLAYPISVCITVPQREHLVPDATFIITGTQGMRMYHLTPGTASRGDVVIADCSTTPPTMLASGLLTDVASTSSLDPETVIGVHVWGPTTDPQAIPADQMKIDLTVNKDLASGSTLILADGSRFAASSQTPVQNTMRLSYLVPLRTTSQRVGWQVGKASSLPAILPIDLPAPTERLTLLRSTLIVTPAASNLLLLDGAPTLAVSLTLKLANDAAPLTLLPTDLVVGTENRAGNTVAVDWTPPQLKPGESVVTIVHIPLGGLSSPIDMSLSGWHARLRWAMSERR